MENRITLNDIPLCHNIDLLNEELKSAIINQNFSLAYRIKIRMIEITYTNEWLDGEVLPPENGTYFCYVKFFDKSINDFHIKKRVVEFFYCWILDADFEIVKWLYYTGDNKL